ncbi:APC family permease [Bradyrhizobium sp. LTSP885]|uniref:APC family permease n=1 Tax=Bradyrhizobium sp. LTSP885 TaxID=1619232 RepID=UPI000AD5447F|nr:APC family permease [Bradyrhizobium sp. LTSP885]
MPANELRGNLGATQVTLLVIAAAAPLGAIVGTAPIAFMKGNGAGLAGTYLAAGLLMSFFVVGYTALIRSVPGAGAFYRYLSEVFGERIGTGAAWVALTAYLAMSAALAIFCGYFADLTLKDFGVDLGWQALTVAFVILVGLLGRSSVDFAARILVPMVVAGFAMLLILVAGIVLSKGSAAFPITAIEPSSVFAEGLGIAVMTTLASFIGIESSALYVQEARDAKRVVPRATLAAVVLVALLYFLSIWVIVGDLGPQNVKAMAERLQGDLVLQSFRQNTGSTITAITSLMLCLSNFACYLALHNAAARYVFTLSGQGQLPLPLSFVHPVHGAPSNASLTTSAVVAVSIAVPMAMGLVPYAVLMPSSLALGTIGIVSLQAAVAYAIVVFFRRERDPRRFTTLLMPLLAGLGLTAAVVLIVRNYDLLTGSDSRWVNSAPIVLLAIFVTGVLAHRQDPRLLPGGRAD